jgi:hypothetical protein
LYKKVTSEFCDITGSIGVKSGVESMSEFIKVDKAQLLLLNDMQFYLSN